MGLKTSIRNIRDRVQRERTLSRFNSDTDPLVRTLAAALHRSIARDANALEHAWFDRLELYRRELESSRDIIVRRDYGAGAPTDQRTADEMATGVVVEDSLGRICKVASKPPVWCSLLFRLVRSLRPAHSVELGTCVGISTSYLAAGLHLNGSGILVSLEGADSLAEVARNTLATHGLTNTEIVVGRFDETLRPVLARLAPVDFIFIDGHHDEHATTSYFDLARNFAADRSVFVFDDIRWSEGMRRAWQSISTHASVDLAVDLGAMGLTLINRRGGRQQYAEVLVEEGRR